MQTFLLALGQTAPTDTWRVAGSMPLFISLHTSKSDGDDTGGGGDTGRIRPADNGLLIVKREETLSVANHPPITIEECSSSC